MELNERIELSIVESARLMPSTGIKPFTMICLESVNFPEILGKYRDISKFLLFVLVKNDFSKDDIEDYVKKSKEYQTLSECNKDNLLNMFRSKSQKSQDFIHWKEMVANIATGLVLHIAKTKDVYFDPIDLDLSDFDELPRFKSKNLSVYQVYNTYLID